MALQTNGSGKYISALIAVCTFLLGFIFGDGLASYSASRQREMVEKRLNERMDRELAYIQHQLDTILAEVRN